MRYRPHRGGLAESTAETVEFDGSRSGLIALLRRQLASVPFATSVSDEVVRVKPYGGDDDRIGWKDVHVVFVDGWGVMGFCEGPAETVAA